MKFVRVLMLIFLSIITNNVFANCSFEHIGHATLNEVFAKLNGNNNQRRGYLEVKILDSSVTSAVYNTWKVKICTNASCETLPLSSANTSNLPWVYFDKNDFNINLIDFDNGFDLSLIDGSNDFIDYIEVGADPQDFEGTCSYDDLAYVFPIPGTNSGTKLLNRSPDGIGSWIAFSANNGETPGEGNTPPTNNPYLVVSDDSVMQGEDEHFVISIEDASGVPSYSLNDINIEYKTSDNTAESPTHYTGVSSTLLTIPAGFNSATIPIETISVGDQVTRDFNFDLNTPVNAIIGDSRGIGTITPPLSPILDLHFDEHNWDADDSIIDISGNDYHANAVNVSPTEGFICNAADLSATGTNDYLSLDHNAINGLKDFTLSAWVNTARTSAQTILSVANSTQSNEAVFYYENNTSFWPTLRESPFNTSTKTSISNISTDSWKHHVWTRKTNANNGELCLHIDNVLQGCTTHNNGEFAIDVDANGFILGQEQDSVGGGFDSSQAFSGLLDEVLLFDGILSTTEITDINNNQVQGKNWDGTERSCGPVEPIAEWRMDEQTWNGSAGEIIDDSGNDYHGEAVSASTTEGFICNAADLSATGTNDYLSLDHNAINGLKDFTLSAWVNTARTSAQTILSVANSNQSNEAVFYYENNTSSWPTLRESPFNTSTKTTVSNISTGSWKHHVWTRKTNVNNGELCLYIDNVLQGCSTHNNGEFAIDVDATGFILGQEQDSLGGDFDSSQAFSGLLDEVLLFDGVLSASEINNIYNNQVQGKNWDGTERSCDSFIDHFEIDTLGGQGITCEADQIIIKACADASCNTVNPDAVDVQLSINNVPYKTVTVSGDNGTSTSYSYTTVGDAELSLDQTYECKDTSSTPCIVDFKDSGFIFSDIPMQISGKSSSEGFNATTLSLRAVETNTTTGACIGTFPNNTDVGVNLSYSCDGGDCKDLLALSNNGNSYDLTETATAQDLNFSTESTAIFTLNYPHAGKFIINAQKDVEVEDSDGSKIIKDFSASSNAFVERPFGIKLDFSNDSNSTNALAQDGSGVIDTDGSPFKKAGESFTLTATAMQWINGQDETGAGSVPDGIPDDFVVFNQNTLKAENFAGGEVSINNDLLLPNPGNNPVLNIIANNSFNASTSSLDNQYSFDEVGIIELKSTLASNDYLGAGDILGAVTNVGRFTPAYFIQTVAEHGSLNAYHYSSCDPITNDWAYAGQTRELGGLSVGAISYKELLAPIIHITAYNLKDGITQNYTESGFMKLVKTGIDITEPVADNEMLRLEPIVTGEKVMLSSVMTRGEEPVVTTTKGVVSYTFNALDDFVYEHTKHSKIAPFPAKIPFLVTRVEDADAINLSTEPDSTEKVLTQGVEIRFGRWQLDNSYGPDTSNLPVTMRTQHFIDDKFIDNEVENCQVPQVATKISTGEVGDGGLNLWDYRLVDLDAGDSLLPSNTDASVENKSFVKGVYQSLLFSAPGESRQGSLQFEYQVPPWLQYDWNNDEDFINNPTSTLTFGIYRGNDRIIYQREISR